MREPFKEGDSVLVIHHGEPVAKRRIVSVAKKHVKTDKGGRWTLEGSPYPAVPYPTEHIEHVTVERESRLKQRVMTTQLKKWFDLNLSKLTIEELESFVDVASRCKGRMDLAEAFFGKERS